jgi:hypothetical protein
MKKFIIYKTTNLLDGKFYIGKTTTDRVNDKYYLGSGVHLTRAIKQYGKKNFVRETLFQFDTESKAYDKEKELITADLLESTECYNIKPGGKGGWQHSPESISKIKQARKKQVFNEETKQKMSNSHKGKISPLKGRKTPRNVVEKQANGRRGHTKSEETKKRISESVKLRWAEKKNK